MKGFKMGFLDENGNMVEMSEDIEKIINEREKHWFDKMKDIDKKCGILLDQLALTEKALELACKEYSKLYCWHYCSYDKENEGFVCDCCENGDYKFFKDNFLVTSKEMMKK